MKNLNKIVRRYLRANGISQTFFADWCGIGRSQCQHWLDGERKITDEQLKNVLAFLNGEHWVTFDQIVTVIGEED